MSAVFAQSLPSLFLWTHLVTSSDLFELYGNWWSVEIPEEANVGETCWDTTPSIDHLLYMDTSDYYYDLYYALPIDFIEPIILLLFYVITFLLLYK